MIGDPPLEAGTLQDRAAVVLPEDAVNARGADAMVAACCGVADDSLDCGEVPTALTAATL